MRALIFLRYIGIIVLIIAILLIIIRWKFPRNTAASESTLDYWKRLWRSLTKRLRQARETEQNLKALENKMALLVDPDEKSARITEWKLQSVNCGSMKARSGRQAVQLAAEGADFIIADALMPDMPAPDFYRLVNRPDVPIIFVGVMQEQLDSLRSLGQNVVCITGAYDPDKTIAVAGAIMRDIKDGSDSPA